MAASKPSSVNESMAKISENRPLIPRYDFPNVCIKTVLTTNFNKIVANCPPIPVTMFLIEFVVLLCLLIMPASFRSIKNAWRSCRAECKVPSKLCGKNL